MPFAYGIVGNKGVLKDTNGDEISYTHDYSLIEVKELGGKYYIELRNSWGHNFKSSIYDYEIIKDSAIIMVDLKKVIC